MLRLYPLWPLLGLALFSGCKAYRTNRFTQPVKLGGVLVPPEVLNEGERTYLEYCRTCHGEKGDGKGPTAPGLQPPPRDFTSGLFKFGSVPAGSLPSDEDLIRLASGGLRGTAMLAWTVPAPRLQAVIQYLKTFSPRWQQEEPGEPIRPTPDPWQGPAGEALARGKRVYHGLARCQACHPAYASRPFVQESSRELAGNGNVDFRPDPYAPVRGSSDFGFEILAPDFTRAELRSIRPEHRLPDLYRVIAAGVGGTAMPTWRGSLEERDLWALVHYVDWLAAMKGTDRPAQLLGQNRAEDAAWRGSAGTR